MNSPAAAPACVAQLLCPTGELLGLCVPEEVSEGVVRLLTTRAYSEGLGLWLVPGPPHPLAYRRLALRVQRCDSLPGGGYRLTGTPVRPLTATPPGRATPPRCSGPAPGTSPAAPAP